MGRGEGDGAGFQFEQQSDDATHTRAEIMLWVGGAMTKIKIISFRWRESVFSVMPMRGAGVLGGVSP